MNTRRHRPENLRFSTVPGRLDLKRSANRDDLLGGYTESQLREAFDLVCDEDHWKDEVDCKVAVPHGTDLAAFVELVRFAILFFTATAATVTRPGNRSVRVEADGYWCGPAN